MRNFILNRVEDESGVSGTGIVAEGTQFSNGKCVVAWVTQFQSVTIYDSIEEVENIHGHNGKTIIEFDSAQQKMQRTCLQSPDGNHHFEPGESLIICLYCGVSR